MLAWIRRILGRPPTEARPETGDDDAAVAPGPAELPLDGELDLHTFRPEEVADLVREYVRACRAEGVLALRVVHGKGKGVLRRTVHATLAELPEVASYRLAGPERGGWGATLVDLVPPP